MSGQEYIRALREALEFYTYDEDGGNIAKAALSLPVPDGIVTDSNGADALKS